MLWTAFETGLGKKFDYKQIAQMLFVPMQFQEP